MQDTGRAISSTSCRDYTRSNARPPDRARTGCLSVPGAAHQSLSVERALETLLSGSVHHTATETLPLDNALGRYAAQSLISPLDVPPAPTSAMDGYALNTQDLSPSGTARLSVSQRIPAGQSAQPLTPGTAARVFTGSPVPAGADTVLPQETCIVDEDCLVVEGRITPGSYIRQRGEDITRGDTVIAQGTRLNAQHLGLAAAAGFEHISVSRPPRVAVITTGNELIQPGQSLPPGKIYNSNRYVLTALLQRLGCRVINLGIIPDNAEATRSALRQAAAGADIVISSGGASVGEEDHIKSALQEIGRQSLWRIAMRPGRPLVFGHIGDTPFFGLPGNPVSAFVTCCLFVRPYILRLQGAAEITPRSLWLPAEFSWPDPSDRRQYLRARTKQGAAGITSIECFPNQSSGVLSSLAWAHGLAVVPEGQTVRTGQPVEFIPFSELMD